MTTHPVFLPRESHGQRNLAGYGPWSRKNVQQYWGNNITFHSNFASDFSESTFIFCPQEPRKPECRSYFHSLGLLRISWTQDTPCPVILNHLLRHCAGEPGHDPNYQDKSQTPHPYVLLPQTFVLCWSLLLNSSYTQATRKLDCGRQNHLLHRMLHAILCLHICGDRDIPVGRDVIWPICGLLHVTLFSTQLSCPRSFVPYWWVHNTLGVQSVPWLLPTFYLNCPLEEIIS